MNLNLLVRPVLNMPDSITRKLLHPVPLVISTPARLTRSSIFIRLRTPRSVRTS